MLLAAGVLFELGHYIRILLWIFLPVILLSLLLTSFFHFWRKKRNRKTEDAGPLFNPADPAGQGDYLFFDHTGLLRYYRNQLAYSNARNLALQQDFKQLEMKYTGVADLPLYSSIQVKTGNMENTTEQLRRGVTGGEAGFEAEKRELCERIDALDKAFRQLELENKLLQDQLRLNHIPGDEKEILVNKWREEIRELNEKVAEQGWLKDVLEEKNSQIGFLQAQLEQRIKQYHQSEQQRNEIEKGIYLERQELELQRSETRRLHDEMVQLQQEYVRIEDSLRAKEQLMTDQECTIGFQQDQLIYAGNQLREIRQQNELLNAAVCDGTEKIEALDKHLLQEQALSAAAEQKLLANRQLLERLYKELTACIREGEVASPVVVLHPSYIIRNDERDELASS